MKLPELFVRCKLGGKRDGDSNGMMDTRPAISDTRCREERLRGRGDDGEREGVGRKDPEVLEMGPGEEEREETITESVVGVMDWLRVENDGGVRGRKIVGDVLMNAWLCLGPLGASIVSNAFELYPNSECGEYGGTESSCCGFWSSLASSQSKPLPIDVTAQLPTLAPL